MKIIAHRGNIHGPSDRENSPEQIQEALKMGFDVEVDVWWNGKLYLGHDKPEYETRLYSLADPRVWVHAKDIVTFEYLQGKNLNVFYQSDEPFIITTQGHIWRHATSNIRRGIATVLEEQKDYSEYKECDGICTDYPITTAEAFGVFKPIEKPFDLLAMDVDGVLCGSKIYDIRQMHGTSSLKEFRDIDFTAIKQFKAAGVHTCFISGDIKNEGMAHARKIDFWKSSRINGVIDKSRHLDDLCKKYNTTPERICFIGDDYYDITLLEKVGFSFCPADSPNSVKRVAKPLTRKGGEGCIAELWDRFWPKFGDEYPNDEL